MCTVVFVVRTGKTHLGQQAQKLKLLQICVIHEPKASLMKINGEFSFQRQYWAQGDEEMVNNQCTIGTKAGTHPGISHGKSAKNIGWK